MVKEPGARFSLDASVRVGAEAKTPKSPSDTYQEPDLMHKSQRGTAHINIFFFLVMLILFLGAGGFGYMKYEAEAQERAAKNVAQADLKVKEGELFLYQHLVEDLTKTIGEAGQYAGRDGFNYKDYGSPAPLEGVSVPSAVRALMQGFAQRASVPETYPLGQFLGRVESSATALKEQIAKFESDRSKLNGQISALSDSLSKETNSRQDEVSKLNTLVTNNTNQYQSDLSAKDQQIQEQSRDYTTLRQELTDTKEVAAKEALAMRKDLSMIKATASAMRNKIRIINPPQDPDGSIIDASELTGFA